ncbi:hypothetical protein NBRC116601_03470 [Cognatishimia sp. WU-CL00825]|uniref:hypothetical protein n=1 Tax=Cognatishimia sp. WU-CL00825 TaxID=3127658 RepID=UPI003101FABD
MQVALHFGAPYTDENRLQLCLGKNRDQLAERGIVIPRPSSYRKSLRPVLNRFKDGTGDDDLRLEFLQSVVGDQKAERIVFSNDTFLGVPRMSVAEDLFFPGPFNRLESFFRLFDGAEIELFYAIRNPATFLQGLIQAHPGEDLDTLLGHSDPVNLRWSHFMERIQQDFPQIKLTVWCNEDTPLIWDDILREVAGVDGSYPLTGSFDLAEEIMSEKGFSRFKEFLKARPGMTPEQTKRVVMAFLDKFAEQDALEEEVDFPGWTADHVDHLSEQYDADVQTIQNMPNINFIMP